MIFILLKIKNDAYMADFPLIGSMLGFAGDLFQGFSNASAQEEINERNIEFAREMYERQLADNRENWRMQNEYNLPKNQVERLAQAGLNPNLLYGSGSAAVTSPQMPQSAQHHQVALAAPRYEFNPFEAASLFLDLEQKRANIRNTNANTANVQSQTEGQNLSNQFESDTMDLRKLMLEHQNYEVVARCHQIDNAIVNGNLLLQSQLNLNEEQINNLISARFVQWRELDLRTAEIGAQIKQGYMRAQAELQNAAANSQNAAANYLRAHSEAVRNSKLNELTDFQIGSMALDFQRTYVDMGMDESRMQQESFKQEEYKRSRENWNKNFGWTGLSFDDFRSLIPFAPSVEYTAPNTKTGGATRYKF